jgi:hypothetical protein
MTAWGAASLVQMVSTTIQSFQTADLRAGSKEAVSVGIFVGIVALVRSPVTLAVFQADFSLPSLHPKIPFPAAGFSTANNVRQPRNIGGLGRRRTPFQAGPQLLRVQSERLELSVPFGWRIAQPFDSDASRQPAFDRCSNEVRREEC